MRGTDCAFTAREAWDRYGTAAALAPEKARPQQANLIIKINKNLVLHLHHCTLQ